MDKGTSAYTEFSTDPSIVGYMMKNKHLLKMKQGLIHSHNTMPTFFSGEDWSELDETSSQHNFYLSLIINNFNEFTAKVAFTGKVKTQISNKYQCLDQDGETYQVIAGETEIVEKKVLFNYDCDITTSISKPMMEQSYVDRLKLIEEKSEARIAANKAKAMQGVTSYGKNGFPSVYSSPNKSPGFIYSKSDNDWQNEGLQKDFHKSMQADQIELEELEILESFGAYVMRLGHEVVEDTIDNAIEDIPLEAEVDIISNRIVKDLPLNYCNFFKINPEELSPKDYVHAVTTLKIGLETYDEVSITPTPIILSLKPLLEKHIQLVKTKNKL